MYTIARGDRKKLYDLHYPKPVPSSRPATSARSCERVRWDGTVQTPFDPEDLDPMVEKIGAEEIEAVAVCLLHANVNPVHELAACAIILRDELPGLSITLSHEVAREWREYERTSTAVLNAYIAPRVAAAIWPGWSGEIAERGVAVAAPRHAVERRRDDRATARAGIPIQTLLSGPVGGTIGGAALARRLGRPNLLCIDMGGTSFDVSLVVDGKPTSRRETELEGLPVLMPIVDIHTIGAGGGSLAWLEAGGLRVGPQSAGADPGPACYGRGGTQPTVTDANLLLGRLDPAYFLGGAMTLDVDAARASDRHGRGRARSRPTRRSPKGSIAIINAKMADAMRTITMRQASIRATTRSSPSAAPGRCTRVALAEELEIAEVIVPWAPGTFSAWGMLQTDDPPRLRRAASTAPLGRARRGDARGRASTSSRARARRCSSGGDAGRRDALRLRLADMRYVGQEYTSACRSRRRRRSSPGRSDRAIPRRLPGPLRPLDAGRAARVRQPPAGRDGPHRVPAVDP